MFVALSVIPSWISNHIHHGVRDEIIYLFPNFNGAAVEGWEWVIPSHNLLGTWLFIHNWIPVINVSKRGPSALNLLLSLHLKVLTGVAKKLYMTCVKVSTTMEDLNHVFDDFIQMVYKSIPPKSLIDYILNCALEFMNKPSAVNIV